MALRQVTALSRRHHASHFQQIHQCRDIPLPYSSFTITRLFSLLASPQRNDFQQMYFPTIRGSNSANSASSYFLAPRKNNALSHHHHHHHINYTQRRTYLYIPLTWSEFKERFQRWMERAEERIVHVRLLNRKALQQPTLIENPSSSQSRKRPWRQPFTRTQRQNLDRRKRRPWARWLSNQNKKVASPSYGNSLPLPRVSNKSAAKYTNTVATSSTPSSSSLMMSGVQTIHSRYQGWKTRRQEQYQRWKIRRREQYQGWKSRRQEQYQGWKSRRQEQYQGWKSRRQEQYQGWKHRRRQLWEETRSRAWDRTRKILLQEYSQPEWFDKFGRPLTSRDSTGRFVNPWQSQSTNGIHSIGTILRWRWQRLERELRQLGLFGKLKNSLPGTETPASVSPLLHQTVPPLPTPDDSSLQFTWIGHSTGMLTVQKDFNILVDPMFSVRASPYQNSPIGVPRDVPPAFTVSELVEHVKKYHEKTEYDMDSQQDPFGKLDICCITHDHYDHMDENSVKDLKEHVQLWVVPLGIAKWLVRKCGIEDNRIVELEWWQQLSLKKVNGKVLVCNKQQGQEQGDYDSRGDKSMNYDEDDKVLTITCCPASHWASRTMWDRNFRLWCSFAFRTSNFNFFCCGDTGYPETFPLFYQIGDVLGPFDFCAIPIAAYEPEEMMKDAHVNPKEAVQIHKELRSRQSVAIHWGSFQLSEEPLDAPPRDLKHAIQEEEAKSGEEINFSVLTHGETCKVTKAIQAEVIYGSVAPTAMSL